HFAIPYDALFVENEHRAFGDALEPYHVLVVNVVIANHLLVEIAEQRERELLVGVKRLERKRRIDADAEYLRLRPPKRSEIVAQRAEFFRAHGTEGGGKERQHHGMTAFAAEGHRLAILISEGEIRRVRADVDTHESSGDKNTGAAVPPSVGDGFGQDSKPAQGGHDDVFSKSLPGGCPTYQTHRTYQT